MDTTNYKGRRIISVAIAIAIATELAGTVES